MAKVLAHTVTYNSAPYIAVLLRSLTEQQGENYIQIEVTDNSSSDNTVEIVSKEFPQVTLYRNRANIGFCAAHNQAAFRAVKKEFDFLWVLNPDLYLTPACLGELVRSAKECSADFAIFAPKLLKADEKLRPINPPIIDSCGIKLSLALRHFDIGQGEPDQGQYQKKREVFGATGACMLLRCSFIKRASFTTTSEEALYTVYPFLKEGKEERVQLFDEAFFAYREDADLAWRAKRMGYRCLYVPEAVGYHKRRVTHKNRPKQNSNLRSLGVKNRFLLQFNNYSPLREPKYIPLGFLFRNLIVITAVLLWERDSLPALKEALLLAKRARERYKHTEALTSNKTS